MHLRVDKLQVELPMPSEPDPDAAAAVQELLAGRFGEMSTLMNYTYQSFNFRGRKKVKPFYHLSPTSRRRNSGISSWWRPPSTVFSAVLWTVRIRRTRR